MRISAQHRYVRITVDKLANPDEARAIAKQILAAADESEKIPRVGWLRSEFKRARERSAQLPPYARPVSSY